MESQLPPAPQAVRDELRKILASAPFASANRSQHFLRYAVEGSLKDGGEPLKESVIAMEVFDRDSSYDPAIDATVRVEAGRLRTRLRDYYAGPGVNDPVVIDIPKGGYRATFNQKTSQNGDGNDLTQEGTALPASSSLPVSGSPARSAGSVRSARSWAHATGWSLAAAVLILLAALGSVQFYRDRP